jgi:hypothetical protein
MPNAITTIKSIILQSVSTETEFKTAVREALLDVLTNLEADFINSGFETSGETDDALAALDRALANLSDEDEDDAEETSSADDDEEDRDILEGLSSDDTKDD